jgi:NTE family protein
MPGEVALDLALQGGGAHGAFTWGVLDRLLDEPWISFAAISGASAGAINAVVLADGLLAGGPPAAKKALWAFWKRISRSSHAHASVINPFHALLLESSLGSPPWRGLGPWASVSGMWWTMAESVTRAFSPYQFNPLNLNPLLDLLAGSVDFERLRAQGSIRLFIAATNVRSGTLRVFRSHELSASVVMASACLPQIFKAVEIDGESFWDGGYLGNPALLPLIEESDPEDLLIIQLNPPQRTERLRSAGEIAGRLNEITFNASLVKELRGIALLKRALEAEPPQHVFRNPLFARIRALRLHRIAADENVFSPSGRSKLEPEWGFLMHLHGLGARAADAWLSRHGVDLGRRSTLDLETL